MLYTLLENTGLSEKEKNVFFIMIITLDRISLFQFSIQFIFLLPARQHDYHKFAVTEIHGRSQEKVMIHGN